MNDETRFANLPENERLTYFGFATSATPGDPWSQEHFLLVPGGPTSFTKGNTTTTYTGGIANASLFDANDPNDKSMVSGNAKTRAQTQEQALKQTYAQQRAVVNSDKSKVDADNTALNNAKTDKSDKDAALANAKQTLTTDQQILTVLNNTLDTDKNKLNQVDAQIQTDNKNLAQANQQGQIDKGKFAAAYKALTGQTYVFKEDTNNLVSSKKNTADQGKALDNATEKCKKA